MRRRAIERLYAEASDAWRTGVLEGERGVPPEPFPVTGATPDTQAVALARDEGRVRAGRSGRAWEMPAEVWALVLAEAQRPR